jgi:hypothetical protein
VSKAKTQVPTLEWCMVGTSITLQKLDWARKVQHASLLPTFANYVRKKFYNILPRAAVNKRMFFSRFPPGQGSVCIDPGTGVAQAVLLPAGRALVAAAPVKHACL